MQDPDCLNHQQREADADQSAAIKRLLRLADNEEYGDDLYHISELPVLYFLGVNREYTLRRWRLYVEDARLHLGSSLGHKSEKYWRWIRSKSDNDGRQTFTPPVLNTVRATLLACLSDEENALITKEIFMQMQCKETP